MYCTPAVALALQVNFTLPSCATADRFVGAAGRPPYDVAEATFENGLVPPWFWAAILNSYLCPAFISPSSAVLSRLGRPSLVKVASPAVTSRWYTQNVTPAAPFQSSRMVALPIARATRPVGAGGGAYVDFADTAALIGPSSPYAFGCTLNS